MKINTSLILCAGFGKRLNPLTLQTPKPLLKLKEITMLERCINLNIKIGVKKIILNKFYLGDQIENFLRYKSFSIEIKVINDGEKILNTGGGILNMMKSSDENDYLIFNPDTIWSEKYINEINKMQNLYFSKKLNNILLTVNKKLSFDKNFLGDFSFKNTNLIKKDINDFIYIGCQILNRNLFNNYKIKNFPISNIWKDLLDENNLNGFQSTNDFFHLTNLEIFKKLKDL